MPMRFLRVSLLLLGLSACTQPAPPPSSAGAASPTAPLPANVRPDLDRQWLDAAGALRWPPNDGFAEAPMAIVLPPGLLIDRFGGDTGRFFSPKGASFDARALPSACEKQRYTVYRIALPLLVWTGKAARWFDEPGGATQFETDATASLLLMDHVIEPVQTHGAAPCGKG